MGIDDHDWTVLNVASHGVGRLARSRREAGRRGPSG